MRADFSWGLVGVSRNTVLLSRVSAHKQRLRGEQVEGTPTYPDPISLTQKDLQLKGTSKKNGKF